MSKHTAGPWELCHGGHGSPRGFVIDEYYVLNRAVADDVAIAADIVDPATGMPSEANARLIAAAPSMLHTLIECERVLARLDTIRHLDPEWPILDEVRAQIAKATAP